VSGLPPEFWDQERQRLVAVIAPHLRRAALAGVGAVDLGVNFELANAAAADWAAQYTDDILHTLNTTSQNLVGAALADWSRQPGATMGDLKARLAPAFSPQRADLIAVTEVTRAYANGNKAAFAQAGFTEWRWHTNRDDLVCPICGGLNGKIVKIGQPFGTWRGKALTEPPAHPGCRCWVTPVGRPAPPVNVPQALGADADRKAVQRARRHNELAQLSRGELQALVAKVRLSNPLPAIKQHLIKHGKSLDVATEAELQALLVEHLNSPSLLFLTNTDQKGIKRWFTIDPTKERVAIYNEVEQRHYTLFHPIPFGKYVEAIEQFAVSVDEQELRLK
jgi:SPP1 gp7 family putative phage head morphogenesis protein